MPKKRKVEFPKKTRGKKIIKGNGKDKVEQQESIHEHERKFDIIKIDSDAEDDEASILRSLLKNWEAQIKDLENGLERSKDIIHYFQLQNNQMSGYMAIFEARALKYRREAQKSQVRLEEYMGEYAEDDEEEGLARKRPRTMGLRFKALQKQKEEESTHE